MEGAQMLGGSQPLMTCSKDPNGLLTWTSPSKPLIPLVLESLSGCSDNPRPFLYRARVRWWAARWLGSHPPLELTWKWNGLFPEGVFGLAECTAKIHAERGTLVPDKEADSLPVLILLRSSVSPHELMLTTRGGETVLVFFPFLFFPLLENSMSKQLR